MAYEQLRREEIPPSEPRKPIVVARSLAEWRERFGNPGAPTAMTVGNFDGVHTGHRKILEDVAQRAHQSHWMPAVLTFDPHPSKVLRPEAAPLQIETLAQRLEGFSRFGIEAALVLPFTAELAQVKAREFVETILVATMGAKAVLVGENFRFGHKQEGDVRTLEHLGEKFGFEVDVIAPVGDGNTVVSSSAIRAAVREGRMEDAWHMLGRAFALAGEIRPGTGKGRELIVPTLNLASAQELMPGNGVYATEVVLGGKTYQSVTNVGVRPTFDGQTLSIESNLFGFSEMVTSGPMEVRFKVRLRDEQKFPNFDALREQVLKDIEAAKKFPPTA
ncbi:MAG TPA: bifunctional riboflavin kinase/FAD synthetase [Candidatus Acidoferrales bacterium]